MAVRDAEEGARRDRKAEDSEIIYPLDSRIDPKMFENVNGRVSDLALKTGGRSKAEGHVVVKIVETLEKDDEVTFVIRFERNSAISAFNVESSSLSARRRVRHLKEKREEGQRRRQLRERGDDEELKNDSSKK